MLGCPCGRTAHSSYANAGQEAPCCTSEPSSLLQVMSWSPCGCCICGSTKDLLSQQARPELTPCADMQALEKSVEAGGALDSYEVEGPDRAELLQDLAEFQLATVGPAVNCHSHGLHDICASRWHLLLAFQGQKIRSDALLCANMPPGTGLCPGDTSSLANSRISRMLPAADPVQRPAGEQLQRAGIPHGGHGELHKECHRDDQQAVSAVQQVGRQQIWQSCKHLQCCCCI